MAAKKSAPKPSSGLPKASTATVPFTPVPNYYQEQYSGEKYIYTNTIVTKPISNEPFDDRHYPALPHVGGVIYRGFISEHQPAGPHRLRFLFNPNQIDYGFELSQNLVALDQTANIPTAGGLGGHSIGFKIFFDRHYEVAYGGNKEGVYRDIKVLKGLVGVDANQGFMLTKVLKFVFSNTEPGSFYGIITSMTVSIGFFSKDMIPMMAEATINATFSPPTPDRSKGWYTADDETDTSSSGGATTPTTAASAQGTLTSQGK